MELSNVRKKIKEPPNWTKVQLHVRNVRSNVMLVLPNVTVEPSNVRKKIRDHQM